MLCKKKFRFSSERPLYMSPNPIGKYINVMTIVVAEKDRILQGLSFVVSLNMAAYEEACIYQGILSQLL